MRAHMRADAEGLVDVLFTLRTFLRSVRRCHRNDLSASTFSLAFQVTAEHPPGCIGDSKSQTMVTHHIGRFQIFNDDGLVAVYVAAGRLVKRIFTLVSDAFMLACYNVFRF